MKLKIKMIVSFFLLTIFLFSLAEAKGQKDGPKSRHQQAKISQHAYEHIKARHGHNADKGAKTSRFNRDITAGKLNKIATKTLNHGRENKFKSHDGRKVHEYKFQRSVGKKSDGRKTNKVRVVSDGRGNVITAFPL